MNDPSSGAWFPYIERDHAVYPLPQASIGSLVLGMDGQRAAREKNALADIRLFQLKAAFVRRSLYNGYKYGEETDSSSLVISYDHKLRSGVWCRCRTSLSPYVYC